jgi:hypothetical protein
LAVAEQEALLVKHLYLMRQVLVRLLGELLLLVVVLVELVAVRLVPMVVALVGQEVVVLKRQQGPLEQRVQEFRDKVMLVV